MEQVKKEDDDETNGFSFSVEPTPVNGDQEHSATQSDNEDEKRSPKNAYVRLRGLPFSATEGDVREFLPGVTIERMIFTQTFDGRPSGECYCQLHSSTEVSEALKCDKNEMKTRYVEVFTVEDHEMQDVLSKQESQSGSEGCVVRLRGLPYSATKQSITDFFQGLQVVDVTIEKENGGAGRPSGEGYVRFDNRESAEQALQRHRQSMGHRYVEVFRSTNEEMERCNNPFGMPRAKGQPQSLLSLPPVRPPPGYDRTYGRSAYPPAYPPMGGGGYGGAYEYESRNERSGPMRSRGPPSRPSPYDRPNGSGSYGGRGSSSRGGEWSGDRNRVYMRGLPYRVTPEEVETFFAPITPTEIFLGFGEDGRPSGDGAVDFDTANDAHAAMGRNQNKIGARYIELFHGPDGLPGADPRAHLRSVRVGRRPPMPPPDSAYRYGQTQSYNQQSYAPQGYTPAEYSTQPAYAAPQAAPTVYQATPTAYQSTPTAYQAAPTAYNYGQPAAASYAQPTAAYSQPASNGYAPQDPYAQTGQQSYHQQYAQSQQYWSTSQSQQPSQAWGTPTATTPQQAPEQGRTQSWVHY